MGYIYHLIASNSSTLKFHVFSNVFHIRCDFDGLGHGVINAAQAPDRACEDEFATETTAEVNPGGADVSKL